MQTRPTDDPNVTRIFRVVSENFLSWAVIALVGALIVGSYNLHDATIGIQDLKDSVAAQMGAQTDAIKDVRAELKTLNNRQASKDVLDATQSSDISNIKMRLSILEQQLLFHKNR